MSDPLNIVTIRDIAQTGSNVHPGIASRNLLLLALCDEVERLREVAKMRGDALRYIRGDDLPGWQPHMSSKEVADGILSLEVIDLGD